MKENKYVFEKSAARQNDRGRICGSDSVRDACAASSHIGKGWCRGHSDRCTVYLYKCSVRDRLIAIDTADHFTAFGQGVVAALIQVGGLGVTSLGVG